MLPINLDTAIKSIRDIILFCDIYTRDKNTFHNEATITKDHSSAGYIF